MTSFAFGFSRRTNSIFYPFDYRIHAYLNANIVLLFQNIHDIVVDGMEGFHHAAAINLSVRSRGSMERNTLHIAVDNTSLQFQVAELVFYVLGVVEGEEVARVEFAVLEELFQILLREFEGT